MIQNDAIPREINKPWGYEILFSHTETYAGKILVIRQGQKLSLQYHAQKDETLFFLEGNAILEIGNNTNDIKRMSIKPGLSVRIRPNIIHRVEAINELKIIEVSTPELNDIYRIEDMYGRAVSNL